MDARIAAARAAFEASRYPETLTLLQPLVATAATPELLELIAMTMDRLSHDSDAASLYEQAVDAGAASTLLTRAAELYFKAGEDGKAQLLALRQLREHPNEPVLVFILVSLFLKSGEMELVDALKNRLVESDDPEHLALAAELIATEPNNPHNLPLFKKLRRLFPDEPFTRMALLGYARNACDFETVEREEALLRSDFAAGDISALAAEEPHMAIMWLDDEALLREATNLGSFIPFDDNQRRKRRLQNHRWGRKLRIGYVSADFWDDHATMRLLGEVLKSHDPERFEITLFCNTPAFFARFDRGGRASWGKLVSIVGLDDEAAERLVKQQGIDILVDLKGLTGNHRGSLFNRTAAPVQVAWLGFPGTAVGVDCDYIIGDRHVLPEASQPFFHEVFCRLPESYQPNDPVGRTLPPPLSRAQLGLPEDVFLFASFNSPRKLSPRTFDLWARVLAAAPQSHIWVMAPEAPLRAALTARGIASHRIHAADKCAYDAHLARAQAADLALDTFPCNGHTTTSDMLWAGLPVLTHRGHSFAGRVSESLLNAIGLPELVAEDEAAFVTLAAALAGDPARMSALRQRLVEQRHIAPLFNAKRFCRHLERGYEAMADRARKGLPPKPFDVEALD